MRCELCKKYKARGIGPTRGEFPDPVYVCKSCASELPCVEDDGFPLFHFKSENGFWYFIFLHKKYLYPYIYPSFRPDFKHIHKDKVARLGKMRDREENLCKRVIPYIYERNYEVREDILYFTCGSDMNSSVLKKLKIRFTVREKARFFGGKLGFSKDINTGMCKANIFAAPDEEYVDGVLYLLESEKEFDKLDLYMGSNYQLRKILAHLESGQPAAAMVYISLSTKETGRPDRRYIKHMLKGAKEHGLSDEWISKLEKLLLIGHR